MINKRSTGSHYEEKAASYLTDRGVSVTEKNYRCRIGEIDLIGYEHDEGQRYLVFFEVKYRNTDECGSASQAVGRAKQKKICRVCDYYRMMNDVYDDIQIRFDVIAIDGGEITWIKNAFSYVR